VRGLGEGFVNLVGSGRAHIAVRAGSPINIAGQRYEVWNVYIMNAVHGAVTQHDTGVRSWCQIGDTVYVVDGDGIQKIEGYTDNGDPITATLAKNHMDMGTGLKKGLEDLFLNLRSSGDFDVTVSSEYHHGTVELTDGIATLHGAKVNLPRGVRGRHVGFTIQNKDGADFELVDVELLYSLSEQRRGRQNGG
jgi:hypothetical protein